MLNHHHHHHHQQPCHHHRHHHHHHHHHQLLLIRFVPLHRYFATCSIIIINNFLVIIMIIIIIILLFYDISFLPTSPSSSTSSWSSSEERRGMKRRRRRRRSSSSSISSSNSRHGCLDKTMAKTCCFHVCCDSCSLWHPHRFSILRGTSFTSSSSLSFNFFFFFLVRSSFFYPSYMTSTIFLLNDFTNHLFPSSIDTNSKQQTCLSALNNISNGIPHLFMSTPDVVNIKRKTRNPDIFWNYEILYTLSVANREPTQGKEKPDMFTRSYRGSIPAHFDPIPLSISHPIQI